MKRCLHLIIIIWASATLHAQQRISHEFRAVPLSQALVYLDQVQQERKLQFIFDELEDFSVTTTLHQATVEQAVRQVVGFYPMRIVTDERNIYVECIQRERLKVMGRVVDAHGQPIVFANISLLSPTDSCFINGGVSNGNGDFTIPCQEEKTIVRISYIGYHTEHRMVNTGEIGTIALHEETFRLGNVEVKGELPKLQLQGNSLLMTVEGTVLERIGSAEDVLSRVPTIVKKGDAFEIMGKGTPLIYLNSRKLTDLNELRNIQADNIKSIEVVQNPGARYDATVNSVIIIHTRRPQGEGLGIELQSWSRRGRGYVNNERLNLTYRTGSLELFANLFGAYNKNWSRSEFEQVVHADTLWTISNHNQSTARNPFFEGRVGFNYQIGQQHSFGGFYQHTYDYVKTQEEDNDALLANGLPYDQLANASTKRAKGMPYHQVNIYYNGTIGQFTANLNADYLFRKHQNRNTQQELSNESEDRSVNTLNQTRSQLIAEKLIMSHTLWKGKIEFGEEYTYTRWRNAFTNEQGFIANSNNDQHEQTLAPFVELQQQLGRFHLTAGLRYEHVESEYYVGGMRRNEQCRTYNSLFPSMAVSTQLKNIQLSFSYAKRTNRPAYWQLSSDVIYENRLNWQTGNPYLKPTEFNNCNLTAMWRWLFLTVNYTQTVHPILYTAESTEHDSKVNLVTYKNYDQAQWLSVTLGAQKSVELGKGTTWMLQHNVMLMKPWFWATFLDEQKSFNHPMLALQSGNLLSLPHKWLLQADFSMHTHGYQQNVWFCCTNPMLTISLSKDFFKEQLNIKLEGRDILNGGINRFTLYSNRLQIQKEEDNDSRCLVLSLRYRFNRSQSKYKGTGAGQAEKSRL